MGEQDDRSIRAVREVRDRQKASSDSFATIFQVTLSDGAEIEVMVPYADDDEIQRAAAERFPGLADKKAATKELVREFVDRRLSSDWNPALGARLELGRDAFSYWLGGTLVGKR